MSNKRALQNATKELTKAKAPSKPRDIIYDPRGQWEHPGQNTRIPGGNITMQGVPYPVYAQPNIGQPQMMYPEQNYVFPGADYVDEYPQMQDGGTIPVIEDAGSFNEEGFWIPDWESMKQQAKELNAKTVKTKNGSMIYFDNNWNVQSVDDNPSMKKGGGTKGLVAMPKPSKKGLASKAYSRSLEATNKLFTENYLFKKPKDRKRKVFDPNAKYYASGGEYGMPLGAGVSQNFIGNRDNFNVGGIPNLPLRDNRVNYNAYVNRFEPKDEYQDGGISPLEGDLISKIIMNRNRGVDFVDRAYALGDNPGTPMFNVPDDEEFGSNMSHKMAWGTDNNGQAFMFPTVLNPDDEAIEVPNQYADYISSVGYKNATGMTPAEDYIETELTPEEIEEYRKGGYIVEDISIPSLNNYQDGGTYTYAGRKDSKYKKDSSGNWLISNASTGNKFTPIKDPTGKRAKELNRAAVPEQSFEKVITPSESTDTQFLKNQMKQVGENRLQEYINAVNYENSVIDDKIKEMRSKDFLTPDERRKGLTNKSKVSKERRNKAIQDLKWNAIENRHGVYTDIKKEYEKLGKLDKVKALPKGSIKSTSASVYDILTNPLDAFKYAVSTGDVSNMPANYNKFVQAGINPLEHRGGNMLGDAINAYNPIDIGDKVAYNTRKGDFVMAGLHALRALPYAGPIGRIPGVARTLGAADKYIATPIETGLKYAPFANAAKNASPLVNTIAKNITGSNLLKARGLYTGLDKFPQLVDALGNVIKKKDAASLKKATELGVDAGFNLFSGAPAASEYFLSKAAFNVLKPKQEEFITTKDPLLGGSAFDYLSVLRNLPIVRAKGGETKYVDTELTDAEIQDLIDDGYVVELL
jgi:hypothetical protein